MGRDSNYEQCIVEIWLPQLALGMDMKVKGDLTVGEAGEAALKELLADHTEFALISMLKERDLPLARTFSQEGIKRGDRLVLLFRDG